MVRPSRWSRNIWVDWALDVGTHKARMRGITARGEIRMSLLTSRGATRVQWRSIRHGVGDGETELRLHGPLIAMETSLAESGLTSRFSSTTEVVHFQSRCCAGRWSRAFKAAVFAQPDTVPSIGCQRLHQADSSDSSLSRSRSSRERIRRSFSVWAKRSEIQARLTCEVDINLNSHWRSASHSLMRNFIRSIRSLRLRSTHRPSQRSKPLGASGHCLDGFDE